MPRINTATCGNYTNVNAQQPSSTRSSHPHCSVLRRHTRVDFDLILHGTRMAVSCSTTHQYKRTHCLSSANTAPFNILNEHTRAAAIRIVIVYLDGTSRQGHNQITVSHSSTHQYERTNCLSSANTAPFYMVNEHTRAVVIAIVIVYLDGTSRQGHNQIYIYIYTSTDIHANSPSPLQRVLKVYQCKIATSLNIEHE